MSEKIDMRQDLIKNNFFSIFIAHVIGDSWKERGLELGPEYEISLTINGIEFPIRTFVKLIEKQMDRMVVEKAKDLLKDKFNKLSNSLFKIEEMIDREFYDLEIEYPKD